MSTRSEEDYLALADTNEKYTEFPSPEPHGRKRFFQRLVAFAVVAIGLVVCGQWVGFLDKMAPYSANEQELSMKLDTTIPVQSSLDRAYNLFRGKFLDIHFSHKIGRFVQSQSTVSLEGTVYYMLDGVQVLTSGIKTCNQIGSASSSEKTASTLDMRQEGESQMDGYDQTTTVSATVPAGGAEVGASRDLRLALLFGSSSSMTKSHEQSSRDYSYHLQVKTEADSFKTITNWNTMQSFSFDASFVAALNDVASTVGGFAATRRARVFKFFNSWGSHVISQSVWGMECTKSLYFKAGYRSSSSSLVESTVNSREIEIFGIQFGSSSSSTTTSYTDSSTGITYEEMGLQCQGELPSACNGAFTGNMMPEPMKSSMLGVWDLVVPGVTNSANMKSAFEDSVSDLVAAAQYCSATQCNGRGVCSLSSSFWDNIGTWDGSFVTSRDFAPDCVCETGVGRNCQDVVKCLAPLPWWQLFAGDLQAIILENSLADCEGKCVSNANCYTYVYDSQSKGCALHGNTPIDFYVAPVYQVTSARCRGDDGATCTRHVGFNIPHHDYVWNTPVQNLDECENLCIVDLKCKGFVFMESTSTCWLKNGFGGLTVFNGLVSGTCRS